MTDSYKPLFESIKRLVRLRLEGAKLAATDKASVLMSTVALFIIVAILAACIFLFCSLALIHLMATAIPLMWAYLIMGGFYILLLVVLIALRHSLIFNPVARFLSRLFLTPPQKDTDETEE